LISAQARFWCSTPTGLVESRSASIDVGLERVRAAVHSEPAEQVCIKVMGTLAGAAEPTDDIAVLVVAT